MASYIRDFTVYILWKAPKKPCSDENFGKIMPTSGAAGDENFVEMTSACPIRSYCQVSNIRRTKSQHLKDSHTVLWLSLPNALKPDVKSRMKM